MRTPAILFAIALLSVLSSVALADPPHKKHKHHHKHHPKHKVEHHHHYYDRHDDDDRDHRRPAYRKVVHHYHYYPESNVYYDRGRGSYVYLDNGRWRVAVELPRNIRLGRRVDFDFDGDNPWRDNDRHRREYRGRHDDE